MGTNFPAGLDSHPSASTLSGHGLNTDQHSDLHGDLGLAVDALEVKVGVDSSAVSASLDYRIAQLEATVLIEAEYVTDTILSLSDKNKMIRANKATALTITIPANSVAAFPVGSSIVGYQAGTGQVTIAAAGGVTINVQGARFKTIGQFSQWTLYKRSTNEWLLEGSLTV